MASVAVPERLTWAVETLEVRPGDRLLEIGCGRGVAVALVCPRLDGGHITAIDRSATAIEAAVRRNAEHVAAGRAAFEHIDLETADLDDRCFDKIFAVNVNHFWVRDPATELDRLVRVLNPGGALYLFYEPPSAAKAAEITASLRPALIRHRLTVTTSTARTAKRTPLLCLKAGT
ncbi:Methyltransferase domain-containing protein [Thermomonospora echinospora]|uniref:Methyltransferase domain-containing protein n=1 Tax=Thermomonospora echinospora TaxID=1992 RepID=A0A1H6B620_9ACTN|nr:class I SAM-dependent methyltransferase [Thermomonospora echinospora]SEG56080.1 Methyltransferase domain-containing protein [Thermomonospora echinospora]